MAEEVTFAPLRKETATQVSGTLQQLLSDVSGLVAWAEEHDSPQAAALVRKAVAEVMVVALRELGRPLMGVWDEVLPDRLKSHLATAVEVPALGDTKDDEISTDEHEAIS